MTEHRKVLNIIKSIRESFPDAGIVYRYGACYGMYQILKQVFPKARAFVSGNGCHVVTEICGRMYDVHGEIQPACIEANDGFGVMNKDQHDHWEGNVCGQRFEYMLRKYNREA